MSTARDEILRRIRAANDNAGVTPLRGPQADHPGVPDDSPTSLAEVTVNSTSEGRITERTDGPASGTVEPDVVTLFVERAQDYKAVVERSAPGGVPTLVAAALSGADAVVLPVGLPDDVVAAIDASLVHGDPGSAHGLDAIEAVVTTCAAAIAETGTIVLDHTAGQGRRALTLVPDLHVCLVRADQIHLDVPSAIVALRPAVETGHPLTWISGPSATSDIELDRVEGVHGPRRLHVIVIEP